jgi:hypothetical protein
MSGNLTEHTVCQRRCAIKIVMVETSWLSEDMPKYLPCRRNSEDMSRHVCQKKRWNSCQNWCPRDFQHHKMMRMIFVTFNNYNVHIVRRYINMYIYIYNIFSTVYKYILLFFAHTCTYIYIYLWQASWEDASHEVLLCQPIFCRGGDHPKQRHFFRSEIGGYKLEDGPGPPRWPWAPCVEGLILRPSCFQFFQPLI